MAPVKFTVFGGSGFIGSHLVRHLTATGHEAVVAPRDVSADDLLNGPELGHVVYAIGTTGNFRENPHLAIEAHVDRLVELIRAGRYSSWLYLSSTRTYGRLPLDEPAGESKEIPIMPSADAIYDLSKLLGEAVCLAVDKPSVRIARLSNVYGSGQSSTTFLGAVLDELRKSHAVTIGEAPDS